MGRAKDAQTVNVLLPALQDATPAVRASAAEALGNIGPREAVESLCEALEDPEPEVRRQAALALGKIGDPAALPALQKKTKLWTLFIDEESVRAACRQAIAAIEKKAGDTLTLPRPVEGPEPATETLPRPAGAPEPSKETLPRPAGEE
jgi:HEAT repeat protein